MSDIIVVDTNKLNGYAQRLTKVTSRVSRLDSRIDSLYFKVKLTDLRTLRQADTLTRYNRNLGLCRSYLLATADDFERVEHTLSRVNLDRFSTKNIASIIGSLANNEDDSKSWIARFINNELVEKAALWRIEIGHSGTFLGANTSRKVSASFLAGEAGLKNKASFKLKNKDGSWNTDSFGFKTEAYATGALAQGEASGNIGYLHGKASTKVVTGAATGEAKCTIFDDGKFRPSIELEGKVSGSVIQGEIEGGFGTDQYGISAGAEGSLLNAEAGAGVGAGYLGTDKKGKALYGVKAEASALASAAQGEVKGGITIFGIDIDLGVKGHAGAIGGKAGGAITTDGAKLDLGGALGVGAEVSISVDWSDAKWVGKTVDAIGDTIQGATEFVGNAYDTISTVGGGVWKGFTKATGKLFGKD
ncbi:MAG: hypothetical protein J6L62_00390 [Clostridia bacterium]|nr:hypothetical protein [Clostridia bacterium]